MSFFGNHPPNNILENFDTELQCFYSELLSTILKTEKLKKIVLESLGQNKINHIQKLKSKASLQNTAYMFRYGPCYTSAVANHMLRVIKDNPFLFRDALWKRCVNICCFGTVPVFEILAFSKVFSFAQELFWESTRKPLQINVSIVKNGRQGKKTTSRVLQVLLKANNMLDTSKITVRVKHIKANPAKLLDSSIEVLKEADIVTMVKFVPAIQVKTVMEQFIWEIADSMKVGSILLFLDTGLIHYQLLQNVIQPLNDFQSINGPNIKEPFTLSIKSIQKCVELYWSRFQGNICLTSCLVNSCAWLKSDTITKLSEIESFPKLSRKARREKASKAKRELCERALKSQKVLEDFHQKVRHILPKKDGFIGEHEEDDSCNRLDYPKHEENILFKNKSKERRIYLDDRVDFSVA